MKYLSTLAVVFIAAVVLGACTSAKTKQIIVNSEPQGAVVIIDGEEVGHTPIKRDVEFKNTKKERHLVVIKKKGYEPQERWIYYRDDNNVMFELVEVDK